MKAHLVLKPAGEGPGNKSVLPTAETINQFMATKETIEKAESTAKQLGFKVVSVTPLQVTIEGSKEQFENAFSSRLKPARSARKRPRGGRTSVKNVGTQRVAP